MKPEWLNNIKLLLLSPKVSAIIFLFCFTILYLPDNYIPYLDNIKGKYGEYITMILILAGSGLLVHGFTCGFTCCRNRDSRHKETQQIISSLSDSEIDLLQEIHRSHSKTVIVDKTNTSSNNLIKRKIIKIIASKPWDGKSPVKFDVGFNQDDPHLLRKIQDFLETKQ